jgi:hypothetical protein
LSKSLDQEQESHAHVDHVEVNENGQNAEDVYCNLDKDEYLQSDRKQLEGNVLEIENIRKEKAQ